MRPVVYIVLAVVALITFKAFFLDEYLAERKAAQANATESNATTPQEQSHPYKKPISSLKTKEAHSGEQNTSSEKPKPSYSDMPLEKVGNKIAEKIEGHF